MRIALFGGSFDPPHLGHLEVANQVVQKNIADEVWFVPCANHPFAKQLSPAHHRLAMLKILDTHTIYEFEIKKDSPSYSFQTLQHAQQEFPQHRFQWLIGSDQLQQFKRWYAYGQILEQFGVLVYPREGYPMTPLLEGMTPLVDLPTISMSSTQIRSLVSSHRTNEISLLTKPEIAQYIQDHHLYL